MSDGKDVEMSEVKAALKLLGERLVTDGGRYLLSVGKTREEIDAAEAPTYGGKERQRWLTDDEYAGLCLLLSTPDALDARRYRWLVANHTTCKAGDHMNPAVVEVKFISYCPGSMGEPFSLDEAIDAALASEPHKER